MSPEEKVKKDEGKEMDITQKYNFKYVRDFNFLLKFVHDIGTKWKIDPVDFKVKPLTVSCAVTSPWIHTVKGDSQCTLYTDVMLKYFNVISSTCMNCFKVLVIPRTFKELMLLHDLQIELGFTAKCGIEIRKDVPRLYGGYFYTPSLEVGRIRYQTVREAVDDVISPDVEVLLKRGCTEMEAAKGPSSKWTRTPVDDFWEAAVIDNFEIKHEEAIQPPIIQLYAMYAWMRWAWMNGDKTVMEFNDGKPLTEPYVTYHNNKLEVEKWRSTPVSRDVNGTKGFGDPAKP